MLSSGILNIINFIFLICLFLSTNFFLYRLRYIYLGFKKINPLPTADEQKRFCVLIAARNESNVIERLLKSLKEQNYPKDKYDVYVIVESEQDKTIEITKRYGYIPFVRKHLELKGKGYALNECIQEIFKNKKDYDIVTVIDADNIVDPNMLKCFNDAFALGYRVGNAYRRQLNEEGNPLADCSTLTFAGINTFQNKARTLLNKNIIMSGSGLYLDFDIIKTLGGWTFTTLTEDYELSMYCTINNIKTAYLPYTYYYDEQPTTFSQSRKQRVRWIKGFFQVRKKYGKELKKSILHSRKNFSSKMDIEVGIVPNIMYIVSIICYLAVNLGLAIYSAIAYHDFISAPLKNFIVVIVLTYLVLMMYTMLQLKAESEDLPFSTKSKIKILLVNPIYITLYVPFAIEALFSRKVGWDVIKHGQAEQSKQVTDETIEEEQDKDEVF